MSTETEDDWVRKCVIDALKGALLDRNCDVHCLNEALGHVELDAMPGREPELGRAAADVADRVMKHRRDLTRLGQASQWAAPYGEHAAKTFRPTILTDADRQRVDAEVRARIGRLL